MEGLFILVPAIILGLYLLSSIKILSEYERGVIFRLGRLLANAKGPGIILVFGPIDRIVRIDMRQQALEVPPQDIITRDNVTLKVNAVIFLRVIEPRRAVVEPELEVAEQTRAYHAPYGQAQQGVSRLPFVRVFTDPHAASPRL